MSLLCKPENHEWTRQAERETSVQMEKSSKSSYGKSKTHCPDMRAYLRGHVRVSAYLAAHRAWTHFHYSRLTFLLRKQADLINSIFAPSGHELDNLSDR